MKKNCCVLGEGIETSHLFIFLHHWSSQATCRGHSSLCENLREPTLVLVLIPPGQELAPKSISYQMKAKAYIPMTVEVWRHERNVVSLVIQLEVRPELAEYRDRSQLCELGAHHFPTFAFVAPISQYPYITTSLSR